MVTIRQGGVRDAQELLLEAFQTGSFYGPLSWNKLFDARLFKEKGIHYDETMLFGDDASVLHRVFEGERCNCLTDVLYHYRTRAGQITTAGFPPRKTDDLRMYWEWLQYFSARPGARSTTTGPLCGTGRSFTSSGASPMRRATCPRSGQSLWRTKSIWMPFARHTGKQIPAAGREAAGCRVLRQPHADLRRGGCLGTPAYEEGEINYGTYRDQCNRADLQHEALPGRVHREHSGPKDQCAHRGASHRRRLHRRLRRGLRQVRCP